MNFRKIFVRIFLALVFLIYWLIQQGPLNNPQKISNNKLVVLLQVIDGDSLVIRDDLGNQTRIRLIGIDAPETSANSKALRESNQSKNNLLINIKMGLRSRSHLKKLLNKQSKIWLSNDREKHDQYGRELSYVYTEDKTFINLQMIKDGFARPYSKKPNTTFAGEFESAFKIAKARKLGLWAE